MDAVKFETGYAAAQDAAVLVDRSALGVLKLTGATRVDLIHRMSTQNLLGMQAGEGRATVMTTDIGRIIDRLILYAYDDYIIMLTSEGNADRIARYLMRFVFFNDDFQVVDLTNETAVLAVYGARSQALVAAGLGVSAEYPLHHHTSAAVGTATTVHRTDAIAGGGYFVVCHPDDRQAIVAALTETGVVPIDADTFEYLRIESGVPAYGKELSADFIPLETGLWDDVSFNKGCYTGQEIIARMESRGKLAKQLVRLSATAPITASDITANGKNAGTLTSVATSDAGTVALAYVKTKFLDEETLTAGDAQLTIRH